MARELHGIGWVARVAIKAADMGISSLIDTVVVDLRGSQVAHRGHVTGIAHRSLTHRSRRHDGHGGGRDHDVNGDAGTFPVSLFTGVRCGRMVSWTKKRVSTATAVCPDLSGN